MVLLRSLYTSFLTKPAHNLGVRSKTTLKNLVPTDDLTTLGIDVFLDSCNEIALKFILILETQLLDKGLTMRTRLPARLRALVSADMDKFLWEKLHNLIENILEKLECGLFRTIYLLEDAPFRSCLIMILKTT